jgi:hypothetical protein
MNYDGERCYDFAHTVLQKKLKDLATKLYKRYLTDLALNYRQRCQKMESVHFMVGKFASIMLHLMPIYKQLMYIAYRLRRLTLIMKIQQKISTRLNVSLVRTG